MNSGVPPTTPARRRGRGLPRIASYSVEPAEDGTGYIVTRHDVTEPSRRCPAGSIPAVWTTAFSALRPKAGRGTASGLRRSAGTSITTRTRRCPADPSWDNFIAAVFADTADGPAPTVTFLGYEFDYCLSCADRRRSRVTPTTWALDRGRDDRRRSAARLANQPTPQNGGPRGSLIWSTSWPWPPRGRSRSAALRMARTSAVARVLPLPRRPP